MSKETKTLTVRLALKTYAEFSAAALIKGHRTLSGFVYQFVIQQIREAEKESGSKKFHELVEKQIVDIQRRSSITRSRSTLDENDD